MKNSIPGRYKARWHFFNQWEKEERKRSRQKNLLRLAGDWLDFFLSRHPQDSTPPNVTGIQKMHRYFSRFPKRG